MYSINRFSSQSILISRQRVNTGSPTTAAAWGYWQSCSRVTRRPSGHTDLHTSLDSTGIMGSKSRMCPFMSQISEQVIPFVNSRSLVLATVYTTVDFFFKIAVKRIIPSHSEWGSLNCSVSSNPSLNGDTPFHRWRSAGKL